MALSARHLCAPFEGIEMRVLADNEINAVSGGNEEIIGAIAVIAHEGGVAAAGIGVAFYAGVALGMGFNEAFEYVMGQSFGSWIYERTHQEDYYFNLP